MKKIAAILPCICLVLISVAAKADDTLTFTSSSGSIGPYTMTFNPGNESLKLFCMNDTLYINTGESWTVDNILGSQLSGNSLTSSHATQYEEEAFILSELPTYGNTAVQDALWKVFDSSDHLSGSAATLYGLIGSSGYNSFITSGGYDNYDFYIYNGDSITGRNGSDWSSNPQNFIGSPAPTSPTPEPSSLFLLGSGLLGLAGAARRKFGR